LRRLIVAITTVAMLLSVSSTALAAKPKSPPTTPDLQPVDNLPHPLAAEQAELKTAALQGVLTGHLDKHGKNGRVRVKRGKFVELDRIGEDKIWTVLGEFGDQIHATYGGSVGPIHNLLPRPDRSVDNSTIWTRDFNRGYYEDMLFSEKKNAVSMRDFYLEQSSGRYTVNGIVEDWAQLPYNEARYGADYCGDIVCATTWLFVRDTVNGWYQRMLASGKSAADIDAYLSQFDVWDRYDWDGDGNFNEPDGYIDHFQAVHAGEGQETGGGAQGSDAIWSHRWYAFYSLIGSAGPSPDYLLGGVQIGNSSYWIGDYTVEPENGGVGVFAHEFGHDLGLPDLYDTSGNTGGAENSTGFWTLYSSGSYGNSGRPRDGLGTKPVHMSALEKLMLGWSNVEFVDYGEKKRVDMGPAEYNTTRTQQLVALLPDKQVDFHVGDPYAGSYFYHSGSGNNLDNAMTRSVTLPAGSVTLSAKVNYDIELDWDYAYLTVNGSPVHTNLSSATNPNGQNFGEGITGSSGGNYVDLTADLSAYAGQTVTLGFRYWTDVAVAQPGIAIDDIAITGLPPDGAETDPGWEYEDFVRTTGTITRSFFNAYIAENRVYWGYDKSLKTGPYNFGFLDDPDRQNWVEHFPYQDGLLVWYYDTSFPDNNVGDHCAAGRCGGLFLPVDAHPRLMKDPDGMVWRPRIQSYDSTFGLDRTDRIKVHKNSVGRWYGGLPANPVFDDSESYWVAPDPSIGNFGWSSVPVPDTGTTIRVAAQQGVWMTVLVNYGRRHH
jgi:immune inhibitor A